MTDARELLSIAAQVDDRAAMRGVSFGGKYREPHLIERDQAAIVSAALRELVGMRERAGAQ